MYLRRTLVFGILAAFLIMAVNVPAVNSSTALDIQIPPKVAAGVSHGTIHLNTNADPDWAEFDTGSSDGLSWETAYVIDFLDIDSASTDYCINLEDTTYYVIIQNCTLYNGPSFWGAGIYLDNCDNVFIINCTIFECEDGIKVEYSENIYIYDCVIYENERDGIRVSYSDMVDIDNNYIGDSEVNGIYISNTDLGYIQNCYIENSDDDGIDFVDSSDFLIEGNALVNNTYQIWAGSSNTNLTFYVAESGNYYSDYQAKFPEYNTRNSDTIYLDSYPIWGSTFVDLYPLVGPDDVSGKDPFEHNDDFSSAVKIEAKSYKGLVSYDEDNYKIEVKSSEKIIITLKTYKYGLELTLLGSSDDDILDSMSVLSDSSGSIEFSPSEDKTVVIQIWQLLFYAYCLYDLEIVIEENAGIPGYEISFLLFSAFTSLGILYHIYKRRS
jgi:parallel beta-helix repeat protein